MTQKTLTLEIKRGLLESVTSIRRQKRARVSNRRDQKITFFFCSILRREKTKERRERNENKRVCLRNRHLVAACTGWHIDTRSAVMWRWRRLFPFFFSCIFWFNWGLYVHKPYLYCLQVKKSPFNKLFIYFLWFFSSPKEPNQLDTAIILDKGKIHTKTIIVLFMIFYSFSIFDNMSSRF